MRLTITIHAGFGAPPDALDLLWARVGEGHADARFSKGVGEISADWGEDAPVSMESDEREEVGRRAVLDVLDEICERAPELKLDWYAVSRRRY
jgi:hypothetical protein